MPIDATPTDPVDWTEENLSKVISDIYAQAATDEAFYDQLMAEPFQVLNSRIKVPADYNGRVFARQKNKRMFIMNVPSYGGVNQGTQELPQADYQILCTQFPPW